MRSDSPYITKEVPALGVAGFGGSFFGAASSSSELLESELELSAFF